MEWISKSYRLDTEVIGWLEELKDDYGSVNKGLRAMMAMGVDVETRERLGRFSGTEKRDSLAISSDPRSIPGVPVGLPVKNSPVQIPSKCIHNAPHPQGREFMAERKGLTMCQECFLDGHRGEPRDCRECSLGEGTGAI